MGDLKSRLYRMEEKTKSVKRWGAAAGSHNCGAEEIPRENEFRAIDRTISRDP